MVEKLFLLSISKATGKVIWAGIFKALYKFNAKITSAFM